MAVVVVVVVVVVVAAVRVNTLLEPGGIRGQEGKGNDEI
jgi:hypothetical protein